MEQTTLTCSDAPPATSTKFCVERCLPTFRSSNLPNLTWLLTWSRLKRSGSQFPQRCLDVPTSLSNKTVLLRCMSRLFSGHALLRRIKNGPVKLNSSSLRSWEHQIGEDERSTGRCLCGSVRYQCDGTLGPAHYCHCED